MLRSLPQVIENIYAPKGVVLSPALEHLRSPVKSRLQALTGCEGVDISKVKCIHPGPFTLCRCEIIVTVLQAFFVRLNFPSVWGAT